MGKEMKNYVFKEGIIFGIIIMLLFTSIVPSSIGQTHTSTQQQNITATSLPSTEKTASFTFYVIGKNGLQKQETILSASNTLRIYEKYQELKKEITSNPYSDTTQRVQQEFFDLLVENHALPTAMSTDQLLSLLQPPAIPLTHLRTGIHPIQNKASEWFCNFATTGEGSAFPIIILPRFIPFLLTPIPRAVVWWSTPSGITSVGGLISRTGFLAGGQQQGIALGFWGIGFSIFLPPIMSYGIFGYAVFTRVTAEEFQFYPPNNPPEITQTDPADGQQMVPISTTVLRFEINDANGDLMSYNVTTEPDIGSGSGGLKPDGTYSIPISGLESLTQYTWHIQVTDGKDTTEKTLTFTTEPVAPIISNPSPVDTQQAVPPTLTDLQFTLTDFQGDLLDYTVETAPDIGSGSGSHVHNGSYTVPVADLTIATAYKWYVNVTDGAHWTRKIFTFETTYPEEFNPFDYGWLYRKQITIDHTKVVGDLVNFPVLLSIIDSDLQDTAQDDGDDILFMPTGGVAHKLNHEIESYDSSTGTLVAWVNITSLSSTTDTVFYMYYGHPDCLSKENVKQTWDANYKAVFHMKDLTTSTIVDSTINAITGIKTGVNEPIQATSGKIGNAQSFDNYDDRINIGDISSNNITISAWTKCAGSSVNEMVVNKGYTSASPPYYQYGLYISQTTGYVSMWVTTGGSIYGVSNTATDVNNNNWNYLVVRYDGDTCYASADGGTEQTDTAPSGNINAYSTNAYIGDYTHYTGSSGFNGLIDEVRISNIARSPSWISTEYNNQNNPSGFMIFGPEEPGP